MRARFVLNEFAANTRDKYYANSFVLQNLYDAVRENIPLEEVTEIVEPAAGDGAIIPYIEKLSAEYDIPTAYYDLEPDVPGIVQMDFYKTSLKYLQGRLIMSGPPYSGRNYELFLKKASSLADYVAYVSPHSYLDLKHPVKNLELIYQEDLGEQLFYGSKVFGGNDHYVKTAILIFKRVDSYTDEVEDAIDLDFSIKQFKRGDDPRGYEYFISRQGYNTGEVSDTPEDFFSSIGIKVNNEDMREDLERFLDTFKKTHDHLFLKYSPTTKKAISIPRMKIFIRKSLYNFMNESADFNREGTPYEKLKIGRGRWKPYPKMSVEEFHDWYNEEMDAPYYNDPNWEEIFEALLNDEYSTDEELIKRWISKGSDPDFIRKIIQFRDYFMDFRYVQDLA